MIEADDLLNHAEDIFFELALDNLSEKKMSIIQDHPEALFIEIHEDFSEDWESLLYEDVSSDEYVELGVYVEFEGAIEKLAVLLMSLDIKNNKECHIQW